MGDASSLLAPFYWACADCGATAPPANRSTGHIHTPCQVGDFNLARIIQGAQAQAQAAEEEEGGATNPRWLVSPDSTCGQCHA